MIQKQLWENLLSRHNILDTLSPIILEVDNHPKWKETNIRDTPIFHVHDYGKKGTFPQSGHTTVDGRNPKHPPGMYKTL